MQSASCWTASRTGAIPSNIAVFDADNDGDQDLAIADTEGNAVHVLLNDGKGAFQV
jgi:hypothetical protein